VFQILSVWILLRHDSVRKRNFEKGNRMFLAGVCLTVTGVVLAIVIDFFKIVS
jgi:hypothetical protein